MFFDNMLPAAKYVLRHKTKHLCFINTFATQFNECLL